MHEPLVVKLFVRLAPPGGPRASARDSFRRAQASRADPKAEAAVDRVARATRYDFAVASRSEYACCDCSRSCLVRTAWAGRGGGGSGRLYEDSGFAVEAYE